MKPPYVSVVIPVYNVERYIAETVYSVLHQTYPHFEVIIVNDASPDNSLAVIETISDPRMHIITQENRGLAGARNTGIRAAQGDYIALLDGDDCWRPTKLERHVRHLQRAAQVGISFSRSEWMDEHGQPLGSYLMPKLRHIQPEDFLFTNLVGNGSTPVLRREVLEDIAFVTERNGTPEIAYFDEAFTPHGEDIEFWLRIALQTTWAFEGLPEPLTLYRINTQGLSASIVDQHASLEAVFQKASSYAPEMMKRYQNTIRAFQAKYAARSAIRHRDGKLAIRYLREAFEADWQLVLKAPRQTLMMSVAAGLMCVLPKSTYPPVEATALSVLGQLQRLRIQSDSRRMCF